LTENTLQADRFFSSDEAFNKLYPETIQKLSHRHWTALNVAKKAADFLAEDRAVKILDIGSGVGKFCLAAAWHKPTAFYYGIEQRKTLVEYAVAAQKKLGLKNVFFTEGNFTKTDFKQYDHFYFYNSFYENITGTQKIDEEVACSQELYNFYTFSLFRQLEKMPVGTKLVTFHVSEDNWPKGYHVVGADMDEVLNFLIKI
jgi:hypothetical protein